MQQVYLKSTNRRPQDALGTAVAISGDTAVVGAPNESSSARGVNGYSGDQNAPGSGAAYVFVRQNGVWVQQAYLKSSNSEAYDAFGSAVAISGNTIVVGAMLEDGAATGVNGNQNSNDEACAGAAYVFTRSGTVWSQQAYLKAPHSRSYDLFGTAVAISGATIVVGAHREDSAASGVNGNSADTSASRAGAAFVFVSNGTAWSQQAYLKASDTATNSEFGSSVGISGDAVVVGAPLANGGAGAAYLFQRNANAWSHAAKVTASNAAPGARFGYPVAISGDRFAIAARGEASSATGVNGNQSDLSAPDSGAVYLFTRNGAAWPQQAYLKASNTGAGDCFGDALALDGDRLMVGAYGEDSSSSGVAGNGADNSAESSGAAYLFTASTGAWQQAAYLKASNCEAGDWFGSAVAVSGDTVLAGAERESGSGAGVYAVQNGNGAMNSGAVYGFVIPSSDPEIMVEAVGGSALADGGALSFAPSAPGAMATRVLVVRNTGSGPLSMSGATFSGANAANFATDATGMPSSIPVGGEGVLRVQFTGAGLGPYSAALHITSNDADEASFDIALTSSVQGSAAMYSAWASASGLTGPSAATTVDPHGDGVENLLKYAFRLNGAGADTRDLDAGGGIVGLPVWHPVGSGAQAVFRVEFLRRKGSGITYVPKVSATLLPGSFVPMTGATTVTDLDAQWERVRIDAPRGSETRKFGIVEVSLP